MTNDTNLLLKAGTDAPSSFGGSSSWGRHLQLLLPSPGVGEVCMWLVERSWLKLVVASEGLQLQRRSLVGGFRATDGKFAGFPPFIHFHAPALVRCHCDLKSYPSFTSKE